MTRAAAHGAALDRLAELEDERRFLLRSLADLEREHEAGDIDEHDYVTLRDGYTARAATVLRAIDAGTATLPPPRRWRPRVVAAWVVGTLIVAALAGAGLARSSGQRLPSGAAGDQPADVATLLVQARSVLAAQDPVRAKLIYDEVLLREPDNAEAVTYTGWLFFVLAQNAGTQAATLAVDQAKASLQRAVELDSRYADPHCFLALIALLHDSDAAAATSQIEACFANNPPADLRQFVQQEVERLAASTTTTSGPVVTPPAAG